MLWASMWLYVKGESHIRSCMLRASHITPWASMWLELCHIPHYQRVMLYNMYVTRIVLYLTRSWASHGRVVSYTISCAGYVTHVPRSWRAAWHVTWHDSLLMTFHVTYLHVTYLHVMIASCDAHDSLMKCERDMTHFWWVIMSHIYMSHICMSWASNMTYMTRSWRVTWHDSLLVSFYVMYLHVTYLNVMTHVRVMWLTSLSRDMCMRYLSRISRARMSHVTLGEFVCPNIKGYQGVMWLIWLPHDMFMRHLSWMFDRLKNSWSVDVQRPRCRHVTYLNVTYLHVIYLHVTYLHVDFVSSYIKIFTCHQRVLWLTWLPHDMFMRRLSLFSRSRMSHVTLGE